MIGFGLGCQSILKSGFGFGLTITYLRWIWIGFTIQKKWIEQQPAPKAALAFCFSHSTLYYTGGQNLMSNILKTSDALISLTIFCFVLLLQMKFIDHYFVDSSVLLFF